jgi:hypothetical protein
MQLTPKDIFQIADRYCDSALLQHAHAAGVFDLLQSPRSSSDIATAKGWVMDKAATFLDALAALGLVLKDGSEYRNSPAVDAVLIRGKANYIGDLIEHERLQWELWGRMDAVLRAENAVQGQQDLNLPANDYANAVFHRAMMQLAGELLEVVASLPEWASVHHALDLAGGHGLYLAKVAERHPRLTGEVWDAPSARSNAESVIAAHGVAGRILFRDRDIADRNSYEGVKADAVMLNHCLHHFNWNEVRAIADSVGGILPSGGLFTILDVHLERNRTSPTENALFSLYMMVNTVRGQVHPTEEIAKLFEEAGFAVKTQLLDSMEGDFLMVGRKR